MNYFRQINYIIIALSIITSAYSQAFSIARVHYGGGGDWYSDPSSLPNLIAYIKNNTSIVIEPDEYQLKLTDSGLNNHSFLYLTGHGNIRFTDDEIIILRNYLLNGGFLHADDNYGMDESFRREMKRVFPSKDWVELPYDHDIYNAYFNFSNGLPKIHEHDGKSAQGLGLFEENRLIAFYSYESDLGDGWEDPNVHNNPIEIRQSALKMGVNIIWFALTQ